MTLWRRDGTPVTFANAFLKVLGWSRVKFIEDTMVSINDSPI